jgi:low affinity Fe/Cu permease
VRRSGRFIPQFHGERRRVRARNLLDTKARMASTSRAEPAKQEHRLLARPSSVEGGRRRRGFFQRLAQGTSRFVGTSLAFSVAVFLVLVWGATGPLFHYSDTWQLAINTSTTIITFLMVFVIQHTQNRDTESLRLKLDELIRAVDNARNDFIEIDDLDDEELHALQEEFKDLRQRVAERRRKKRPDA